MSTYDDFLSVVEGFAERFDLPVSAHTLYPWSRVIELALYQLWVTYEEDEDSTGFSYTMYERIAPHSRQAVTQDWGAVVVDEGGSPNMTDLNSTLQSLLNIYGTAADFRSGNPEFEHYTMQLLVTVDLWGKPHFMDGQRLLTQVRTELGDMVQSKLVTRYSEVREVSVELVEQV